MNDLIKISSSLYTSYTLYFIYNFITVIRAYFIAITSQICHLRSRD